MPRVREIKSVKGICLDYIAKAVNEWINKLVVAEVTKEFTNCVIVKSIIILLKKGYDKKNFTTNTLQNFWIHCVRFYI